MEFGQILLIALDVERTIHTLTEVLNGDGDKFGEALDVVFQSVTLEEARVDFGVALIVDKVSHGVTLTPTVGLDEVTSPSADIPLVAPPVVTTTTTVALAGQKRKRMDTVTVALDDRFPEFDDLLLVVIDIVADSVTLGAVVIEDAVTVTTLVVQGVPVLLVDAEGARESELLVRESGQALGDMLLPDRERFGHRETHGLFVGVVASPYQTATVVVEQIVVHGVHEVVAHIGVLHQFEAVAVLVRVEEGLGLDFLASRRVGAGVGVDGLAVVFEEDRLVILSHDVCVLEVKHFFLYTYTIASPVPNCKNGTKIIELFLLDYFLVLEDFM